MNTVVLVGTDEVRAAGYRIQEAATTMKSAVSDLQWALEQHRIFLDDWLARFQAAIESKALEDVPA